MRASFWVVGPLLARTGEAKVSLPGGCAIGTRPVDMHLMAMEKLGATIAIEGGYVIATARRGLKGAHIGFDKVSVGATHAALMAAVMADGDTIIENAASEPEIGDVAECLVKMGARIEGIHTSTLRIKGVTSLSGAEQSVIPDRIETGTYAMCAGMTGGDVLLKDANAGHLGAVIAVMRDVPFALVISAISCACRSVGKPGNGSVVTSTGPRPAPLRTTRTPLLVTVTSAPTWPRTSSAVCSNSGRAPSRVTSPPVIATAMA
jgi:UDP-N-acetylglucosamine 1-carboxyvinyltransferase